MLIRLQGNLRLHLDCQWWEVKARSNWLWTGGVSCPLGFLGHSIFACRTHVRMPLATTVDRAKGNHRSEGNVQPRNLLQCIRKSRAGRAFRFELSWAITGWAFTLWSCLSLDSGCPRKGCDPGGGEPFVKPWLKGCSIYSLAQQMTIPLHLLWLASFSYIALTNGEMEWECLCSAFSSFCASFMYFKVSTWWIKMVPIMFAVFSPTRRAGVSFPLSWM